MSSSLYRLAIATRCSNVQMFFEPTLVRDGVATIACSQSDLTAARALTRHGSSRELLTAATFSNAHVLLQQHRFDVVATFSSPDTYYPPATDMLQADRHLFI